MEAKKRREQIEKVCSNLNKRTTTSDGTPAVTFLGSKDRVELERFSSGCAQLDEALGGGWPLGRVVEVYGPESGGKCHAKGTKILMFDGHLKNVEDIEVGDLVMGPDSNPRQVQALASGSEMMYKVTLLKGLNNSFVVNENHILSLKNTAIGSHFGEIVDISLKEYLAQSKNFRYYHKLYQVPVEWSEKELLVDPYFLGLWLGDGSSDCVRIHTEDDEIISSLEEYGQRIGHSLSVVDDYDSRCPGYSLVVGKGKYQSEFCLQSALKSLGVLGNKHIPHIFKTGSRQQRLELLAGLLDSDGYKGASKMVFCNTNKILAEGVMFVARSLGFFCNLKEYTAKLGDYTCTAFKVYINGDCSVIPLRVARKIPTERLSNRDPLVSSFDVEPVGIDDFYGFILNGDHRYLMGNFIVQHNTTLCYHGIAAFQEKYPEEMIAWIDSEFSFDPEYADKLGVNTEYIIFNQPESGEQAMNVIRNLLQEGVKLIIVDSVAALTPQAELEKEIGERTVGEQARLMSSGLRQLVAQAGRSNSTIIFTNQVRDKIGVCFNYKTSVMLADGTIEWIGRLVNQKKEVEVLSYNPDNGKIEPKKVIGWHKNGCLKDKEYFIRMKVRGSSVSFGEKRHGGYRSITGTENHMIFTVNGEKPIRDIKIGDEVLVPEWKYFSDEQHEIILGSILGDGSIRFDKTSSCGILRIGHGNKQKEYCEWKACALNQNAKIEKSGRVWFQTKASMELKIYNRIDKKKTLREIPDEFIEKLTPKALAIWYMDDGSFSGSYKHYGYGKAEIGAKKLTKNTMEKIALKIESLGGGLPTYKVGRGFLWSGERTFKFHQLIAKYIHPTIRYKIKSDCYDEFCWNVDKKDKELISYPCEVVSKKKFRYKKNSANTKFDISVDGNHSYIAGGICVHNSWGEKSTTPGGRALRFYSSIRLEIVRIGNEKEGDKVVSIRCKATTKKNKTAPPIRVANFCITFGIGIDNVAGIFDMAVENKVINKAGAWFSFGDLRIGQGRAKSLDFVRDNDDIFEEIKDKLEQLKVEKAEKADVIAEKKAQKKAERKADKAKTSQPEEKSGNKSKGRGKKGIKKDIIVPIPEGTGDEDNSDEEEVVIDDV